MSFGKRLATKRGPRELTRQAVVDAAGIHVTQLRRCAAGSSQSAVEVLRKLAVALRASADVLLSDTDERSPEGDLQLRSESVSRLGCREKEVTHEHLKGTLSTREAEHRLRRCRDQATAAGK